MTAASQRPERVRVRHVEWVRERLGQRDRDILATLARLRLATSAQLERLHFFDLPLSHRSRSRRRVLRRLVEWRVLLPLDRRIGGVRAGSAGLIYTLDTTGQWLANVALLTAGTTAPRRPTQPSIYLLSHTLAISELYTQLCELERANILRLSQFSGEPACWWPNGIGGWLKPDAYVAIYTANLTDSYWLEQDMATESVPTMRKKLMAYLDFVRRGQQGPGGVVPRVLVNVPTAARQAAIQEVIRGLPEPASKLLCVTTTERAAAFICEVLRE